MWNPFHHPRQSLEHGLGPATVNELDPVLRDDAWNQVCDPSFASTAAVFCAKDVAGENIFGAGSAMQMADTGRGRQAAFEKGQGWIADSAAYQQYVLDIQEGESISQRADQPDAIAGLERAATLANAPLARRGQFVVPKVIE